MVHGGAGGASRALDLTLPRRNKGSADEILMAGVPHHAATRYLARLLALGHKVAICEQMADPSKTRGIVPRAVVRVIRPGLITDGEQLDGRLNHFLCALEGGAGGTIGIARLDLSTGELAAARLVDGAAIVGELSRLDPRELLVSLDLAPSVEVLKRAAPRAAVRTDEPIAKEDVGRVLVDVLGPTAATDAESAVAPEALVAAARTLRFAMKCNPCVALPVRRVAAWDPAASLQIAEAAQ